MVQVRRKAVLLSAKSVWEDGHICVATPVVPAAPIATRRDKERSDLHLSRSRISKNRRQQTAADSSAGKAQVIIGEINARSTGKLWRAMSSTATRGSIRR